MRLVTTLFIGVTFKVGESSLFRAIGSAIRHTLGTEASVTVSGGVCAPFTRRLHTINLQRIVYDDSFADPLCFEEERTEESRLLEFASGYAETIEASHPDKFAERLLKAVWPGLGVETWDAVMDKTKELIDQHKSFDTKKIIISEIDDSMKSLIGVKKFFKGETVCAGDLCLRCNMPHPDVLVAGDCNLGAIGTCCIEGQSCQPVSLASCAAAQFGSMLTIIHGASTQNNRDKFASKHLPGITRLAESANFVCSNTMQGERCVLSANPVCKAYDPKARLILGALGYSGEALEEKMMKYKLLFDLASAGREKYECSLVPFIAAEAYFDRVHISTDDEAQVKQWKINFLKQVIDNSPLHRAQLTTEYGS